MRKSSTDILCCLSFLGIGAAFAIQMAELEGVSRVFPQALLVVIVLGGFWFVGKGFWLRRKEALAEGEQEPVAWPKVGIIAALGLVYAVLISILGFFSSTLAFLICAALILGDKAHGMGHLFKVSALYSVVFCALLWVCFVKLLNVPTPTGLLF